MTSTNMSIRELAVMAALERLAEENARSARQARERNDKEEAKFFQRGANAFSKALMYFQQGLRPEPTPHGWMLPSQRIGEPAHLLTLSGDWLCTCAAGQSIHWASALVIGYEIASDDMDRFDSADEPTDEYLWSDGTPVPLEMPSWLRGETRIAA
jgi:hypothetical protein